jgi:hypothetical protein
LPGSALRSGSAGEAGIIERLLGLASPIAALILLAAVAEWLFSRGISTEHDRRFQDGAALHGTIPLIVAGASVALALAS